MLFDLMRPALFTLDPERAHKLSIAALRHLPPRAPSRSGGAENGPLSCEIAGVRFTNPLGVAAGYDKDAQVPDALLGLGFGHVEIGSVTPRPQSGNPRPRLFRLVEDEAVINRMGFNNSGGSAVAARLEARRQRAGIVGVNIGANKDSTDRIADYAAMTRLMAPLGNYLTINISSPNTPGLRALQDESALTDLVAAVFDALDQLDLRQSPPVFLKVAPDLEPADIDAIARIAIESRLAALIVSNTTITRPGLASADREETGGLSGKPLKDLALLRLRDFRSATNGAIPLIGVGGIGSADDAWERIRAGASLVQLYSAMVYRGPGVARDIVRGVERRMRRDGFETIAEAVGTQ
jgi:dihydroorotate dehydrogenase